MHSHSSNNPYSTGDIGENYVKYKLAQIGIDALSIDRVYDLFLWRNMHRVEIKTSNASTNGRHVIPSYAFSFKNGQTEKNAFDYAICIGLGDNNKVKDMYIIPQPYIHNKRKKVNNIINYLTNINISTELPMKKYDSGYKNTYTKFKLCKLDLDIFKQKNRSVFNRKKNALTAKLMEFEKDYKTHLHNKLKSIYKDKSISNPSAVAKEQLNLSMTTICKLKRKLKLKGRDAREYNNQELKEKYLELWEQGYTTMEIIKKLRSSNQRIGALRKKLALPRYNPHDKRGRTKKQKEAMKNAGKVLTAKRLIRDKENKRKISKLWRKGHTRMEMEKILGISGDVINRLTKELTLPRVNPYRNRTCKK